MELLSHQFWQIERLATEGLFGTTTRPEYTYSVYHGLAYLQKAEEASRYAHRAYEIFTAVGDKDHARRAERLLPERLRGVD
ncbi:hypothetical protein [Tengunoibacter tsumagoiensis]|uniref:Uncharacterized protein n=1 Tax=Tengunoibacter tsumagoiensis TaxID=2014871 RepID=A0A402A8U5_9CHLR|nr:hypothetical protein [Tengunoibacter tsumagoiensis]GCE15563.1 hypothetical protein KTT_54220 [Tengunoibacter tsumagoiensis]